MPGAGAPRIGDVFILGLSGDCDVSAAAETSGTCIFTTNASLGGNRGDRNIPVSFQLDTGGALTVFAYGSNNAGAMEIRFERLANDSLKVEVGIPGDSIQDYSAAFAGLDASDRLSFFIDVHNGETPTHVLIWGEGTGFTVPEALVDSASPFSPWFGRGTGQSLGYSLQKATLFASPAPGPVKHDH